MITSVSLPRKSCSLGVNLFRITYETITYLRHVGICVFLVLLEKLSKGTITVYVVTVVDIVVDIGA